MQIPPRYWEQLKQLTGHIDGLISLSFREALEEFTKNHADTMYLYNKSDYASNMHAHVRGRIRTNFHGIPWAHIIEEKGRPFMLLVNGHILGVPTFLGIKFKKQRRNLRTSNIQTQSVIDFNSQQMEYLSYLPQIQVALPLPHLKNKLKNPPKGNNLVAGYTPNETWTNFDRLTFTFPFAGGKVRLLSEITKLDVEVAPNVIEMPTRETPRTERIRRRSNSKDSKRAEPRKFVAEITEKQDNVKPIKRKNEQGS